MKIYCLLLALMISYSAVFSAPGKDPEDKKEQSKVASIDYPGLKFRGIGPALTSGRIADLAVNPANHAEYYLAVASGGVWKTGNAGTTWDPIFDQQKSYSTGCVTIDPHNEHTIWVGTGENNNQRSVAYGNGVYKSLDGGKTWKNMGLKRSEHIGYIVVHPEDPDIVYVAAYGPLWSAGGDRGLYRTSDGGENWEKILEVNEYTGINEVHLDPEHPDIMYACAHQRMRHVWTYVGGGPGSALYKSTDGGESWRELKNGLPKSIMGRIGMDISPADPDYLYAIIEAKNKEEQGVYRSTDKGESWKKTNNYVTSGNYYQELYCDLSDRDKVFFMDTWLHHTEDGGKTIQKTGEKSKHVDNHCMWIDPQDPDHWILGSDGGIYETWDHAQNWNYKSNLPVTQFYKLAVDNARPFYNIYGGTQDNNTIGGPSRTVNNHGIMNRDWYITNGGDGFEAAIDPENPDIVYSQSQYGWLVRYDKSSGERTGIKPVARRGNPPLRWNWDAPLIISPHNHKRLYFAANKLFRSDNMGDTWEVISPDLTRQLDRNKIPVMGRIQSADAVMKNKSTSIYGNIVALDESPLQEDLIYVGTDDGLIRVTEDAGENWHKISSFPGVPDRTYVNAIVTSCHDAHTVYAVFNNHKNGDFKPYILKSSDKGNSWKSISGNLPKRGSVYDIAEDHENPGLLFAGTEFGIFFTVTGGEEWIQLKKGIPTISVRDIEIQEREDDLVLATFGRGFYILDDYAPLRQVNKQLTQKQTHIFPVKDARMFVDARPLGYRGKASQGENFFTSPNPPIGAVITYYLNDNFKTTREQRLEKEAELIKKKKDVPYPTKEELRKEKREEKPYLLFTIYNENHKPLRKIREKPSNGINRVVWDFRLAPKSAVKLKEKKPGRYGAPDQGPLALPGTYYVTLHKVNNKILTLLADTVQFQCRWLENNTLPTKDKTALLNFQEKVEKLRRAVDAAKKVSKNFKQRVKYIESAIQKHPPLDYALLQKVNSAKDLIYQSDTMLFGDRTLSRREYPVPKSISSRVGMIIWSMWRSRSAPTQTNRDLYHDAGEAFQEARNLLKQCQSKVEDLEKTLEEKEAPYTPGREIIENWKMERE